MRDYFDVRAIDEEGAISVEEGVELYMRRYGIDASSDALLHLYRTMGDLSDVEVDDLLPVSLPELQRWWSERQVRVLRNPIASASRPSPRRGWQDDEVPCA